MHLPATPDVVVHGGRHRKDALERVLLVDDVRLRGKVGAALQASSGDPKKIARAFLSTTVRQKQRFSTEIIDAARLITARTAVFLDPIDDGIGDERAKPVEEVENLFARDAREEVLVAATEPDYFMREHGADDTHQIVAKQALVDRDARGLAQHAVGTT